MRHQQWEIINIMNMKEVKTKGRVSEDKIREIAQIIDNFNPIVDQDFIDALDREAEKGSYSSRENVDALALEKLAIRYGLMRTGPKLPNEHYQWRHDWKLGDMYIDLKRKPRKYPNIILSHPERMIESHRMNQLTHIVAYSQNIEHNYKVGDVLKFKFLGILSLHSAFAHSTKMGDFRLLHHKNLKTL